MHSIKPGIYYEDSFLGATVGALVFSHGTIYIDAPLRPDDVRAWRSYLSEQRGGVNRLLVSLDSHIDRTLGTRFFDCTILAHQKAAQIFRNRPNVFKGQSMESGAEWESYIDSIGTRWVAPDITFSHAISLHWGGPEIILEHHPGPAPGATWVIVPDDKIIFVGDTVLYNQPPFLANADLEPWIEALDLIYKSYRKYSIVSGRCGIIPNEAIRIQQKILAKLIKNLDRLANRNAAPEATEKLIPTILSNMNFPGSRREQYSNRLRTGLYQYYLRHFRPSTLLDDHPPDEEND